MSIFIPLVSGLVGGLVTLAVMYVKVLPGKVSRDEVQDMIDRHPIHTDMTNLKGWTSRNQTELAGIREEIVGLRTDMARWAATLEALVKDR